MITLSRRRLLNAAGTLRDHGMVPPGADQIVGPRWARAAEQSP